MHRYSRIFDDDEAFKRKWANMMKFNDREPNQRRSSRRQTVDFSLLRSFSADGAGELGGGSGWTTPTSNKRLSWSSVGNAVYKALSDLYPGTADPSTVMVYNDTSRLMELNRPA